MHIDSISSRILGCLSALFLVRFREVFRGHFLLGKGLFKAYLHSLVLFATFYQTFSQKNWEESVKSSKEHKTV